MERSIEIMNSDGTNDERQTDFGSTNSSQTSRGDRRAKKTSGSRYKLSREGMKRFLIDQVAKNGHLQFEYLHEVKITEVGALVLFAAWARMRILISLPSKNKAPTFVENEVGKGGNNL